jgi:C4-dicarboxylate-specific signal transduction histidine kinase
MPESVHVRSPTLAAIRNYAFTVISVSTALMIAKFPALHLQNSQASLFLCAVMFSAWIGGVGPGSLAIALSSLAFDYYFLEPLHTMKFNAQEIPRLAVFVVAAMFVGALSAAQRRAMVSLRRARDDLNGTVQDLQKTNEALHAESLERKRAETLLAGENRLLEMIARGDSRAHILDAVCRLVEELVSGSLSSILLVDPSANRLRHGAAPSLQSTYIEAIDGVGIGPCAGSCGTAAYRAQPVIVTDIATDPLWADYRGVALAHGLRACWSAPILSSAGKVLGTFAIYYREPRSPTALDHKFMGQMVHLASIAVERKLAEEELRQAQADLSRVSRVTTMGELTASLAHEVNQPIAAAVTNANTCLRWLTREQPDIEEARAAAMRIVKDGTRASEIIKRVRQLFQKGASQRELVDVNEIIRGMTTLFHGEATRHNVLIQTGLADDLPQIMADRVQLQQVLMNLMMNAIDAMKEVDGTRKLEIQSRRTENEHLLLSVSDTGVGLPAQQADQIFNAFFTTKDHGTGMGLRISRSIVESHDGRLWATANPERGATFHLTLPTKVEAHE